MKTANQVETSVNLDREFYQFTMKKAETWREKYPDLHHAIVVWESPLSNIIEHREAFFPSYTEAVMWIEGIEEFYRATDMPFETRIDGVLMGSNF